MSSEITTKMKVAKVISIKNSMISGFADEVDFQGLDLIKFEKIRVSKILPVNNIKRFLFILIRILVNDNSKFSAWTRNWICPWNVVIGSISYGPFQSRTEAINFEKDFIRSSNEFSQ